MFALSRLVVLIIVSNLFAQSPFAQTTTTFRGQVLSSVDGIPVENAQVVLDQAPGDGNPEYKVKTDTFGFFVVTNIAAGSYQLGVNTPQYVPYATNITFTAGIQTNKLIKLIPIDGKVAFDIFFQAWCSQTAAQLMGADIQIEYWAPSSDLTAGPTQVTHLTADVNGAATASQSVDGFYRFTISRPGWQTLVYQPQATGDWVIVGDKVRLIRSASATAFLDPIPTDLKVTVTGYDPVLDKPNQPLKNMVVKLTGLNFANPPLALVPTISMLSLQDGTVTFKNLPPIQWQIDVGAPGYIPSQTIVSPDALGGLGPLNVALTLDDTKVKVALSSIYKTNSAVSGAEVHLQGITNTTTEGIDRKISTQPDATGNTASSLFENLLPGRYYIRIQHQATISGLATQSGPLAPGPDSFHVDYFPRESFADVASGSTEEVDLDLHAIPARIQGRISAEDDQARIEEDPFQAPHQNRIWRRIAQSGINFKEHKLIQLLDNATNTFSVDSDDSGHYTILVPPGIFGIQIPTMTNYTGHNIEFGDLTANAAPVEGPWPYPDIWPYPTFEDGHDGAGLRFDSSHEYQLDLFVHGHFINLVGLVQTKGEPFQNLVLALKSDGSGLQTIPYNHLGDVGAEVAATGPMNVRATVKDGGYYNIYILKHLQAGAYNITLDSTEYTTPPINVTIAPWQAPGIVPGVAPFSPTYFFPGINHYDQSFTLNAQWAARGTISINDFLWETPPDMPPFYSPSGTSYPQYFRMDTLPGELFLFNPFTGGIPSPSYTIWRYYGTAGWFSMGGSGSQIFTSYNGGPQNNLFPNNAPIDTSSYTLDLHAYSVADPHMEISGVTVTFLKSSRPAGGQVAHDDSPYPTGATATQWLYDSSSVVVENYATRLVKVAVLMRRGMLVSGTVSSVHGPVPHASVLIRNRYGNPIGQVVTDDGGAFAVGGLEPQSIYIDVNRRGYVPQRKRFEPPSPSNPDVTASFTFDEVRPPVIDTFTMNRFGLFLPGVLKSANPTNGLVALPSLDNASDFLKVTWKAQTHSVPYLYTLEGMVQADETKGPDEQFTVNDPITEVWVVDRRAFNDDFASDPNRTSYTQVTPPSTVNYINVLNWLADIQSGKQGGSPYYVVHQMVHRGENGSTTNNFQGKFNLWEMPSGVFNPRVIAITENGGVAISDYQLPAGKVPLQGMTMPTWAATFTEVISFLASAGKLKYDVKANYGEGSLQIDSASSVFEARISLDPLAAETDTTLDATLVYKYVIGVDLKIGQTNTPSGPLIFAPAFLGTTISGLSAEFKVTGKDQTAALKIGESGTLPGLENPATESLKEGNYIPKFIQKLGDFEPSVTVKQAAKFGQSQYLSSDWLGNNIISGYSYSVEAQGSFETSLKCNITPLLSGVPWIGPPLVALSKPPVNLKVYFVPTIGLGAKLSYERITTYPRISGTTVSAPIQGEQWDFLGAPTNTSKTEFKIFAKIGAGLLLSGLDKAAEGSVGLQLGAPRNSPDTAGVAFKVDPTVWPPIQRITGAFSAVAKIALKVWALSYEKQWQWDALQFDFDFSKKATAQSLRVANATTPAGHMDLTPLTTTYTIINAATAPPFKFVGKIGDLVENFYRAGVVGVTGGTNPLLAFTTVDPNTGKSTLMISARGALQWNSPVPVTTAGGILSIAVVPLSNGGWLAVWSEIDSSDLGNPFPSSRLNYAVSNFDGSTWSVPATITSDSAALFDLKMVNAGNQTVLTWLSTTEGPQHQIETLAASVFDGAHWSTPTNLLPQQNITATSLAGMSSGAALSAVATGDDQLLTFEWNGSSWKSGNASASALGPVSATAAGGMWAVAWQDTNSTIQLGSRQVGSLNWSQPVTIVTNISTPELQLASIPSGAEKLYLLSWIQGGDVNSIYYAIVDANGAYRVAPTEVTLDSAGSYSKLQIRPLTGGPQAALVAQYTSGTNTTLTEFVVGLPAPGDCNGDGVADDLQIASGALADCNHNGIPDICEIASGAVADKNHNGIPDSCEVPIADDCNRNGISDAYELSLGIGDFNGNGILDECETQIMTRSIQLTPDATTYFYRAANLHITGEASDSIQVEYVGVLEEAGDLAGPWFVVP